MPLQFSSEIFTQINYGTQEQVYDRGPSILL